VTVVIVVLVSALLILGMAARDHVMVCVGSVMMKMPRANEFYWMRKAVEAGPAGTRWVLDGCKQGSSDGDVEQISSFLLLYADYDLHPYVLPLLSDPDPQVRGYAALVAGYLGDDCYMPTLEKLANDDTPLPKGWFDRTVAERAARSLGWIRSGLTGSPPRRGSLEHSMDELTSEPFLD